MNTADLFAGLKTASTSPLALSAYAMVIAAWLVRTWLLLRPQRKAETILALYTDDKQRLAALRTMFDKDPPPGLPKHELLEWVRVSNNAKNRLFLLIAYVATLAAVVLVVGMAIQLASTSRPGDKPPVLIDSSVVK
jgi:hypothetical protein